jgi:hypothetical protein
MSFGLPFCFPCDGFGHLVFYWVFFIIVALQVRAVKIYATIVEALKKKKKDRVKLSLLQKLRSPHP